MARSEQPRKPPDVRDLLNRFAAEEDEFLQREFFAPAWRGGTVRVRIGGVICRIRIRPADFCGWGIFQPVSHREARLVREATLAERRAYLELFPLIRLIVCRRAGSVWYGSAASSGDRRIRMEGLAAINLAAEVQLFDCVRTRFDGVQFWFEELDLRHDPASAAYLRAALNDGVRPDELRRRGLTAEERAAYELCYWERVQPQAAAPTGDATAPVSESDTVRQRLRDSLSHAGAQLVDYLERADSFRVSFTVRGQQFISSVDKRDLTVQAAGICLSGEDRKYDLSSLVGVLRQAAESGELVRVGDDDYGLNEEQ